MKFGFVTCVQLGLSCTERIYEIGGKLDLLITLVDNKGANKSGRAYLDELSRNKDVPLLKINHINDPEVLQAVMSHKIDWLFIIGWSQIASVELLNTPTMGCIGMHPTLLPEGRGRASIPWAILKGLQKTGVSMFILSEGVDTGSIIGQIEIPISNNETATQLYHKVQLAHETLMNEVFPRLENNTFVTIEQDDNLATVWEGRKPEDGEILSSMTTSEVERLTRATTRPYPGAYFFIDNTKIIVWSANFIIQYTGNAIVKKLKDGYIVPVDFEIITDI